LECKVDKGAPDGEKYIFHGEADEHPNKEAGDIVFIVSEEKHKIFKRRGADLLMTKEISVIEAICGLNFVIDFIDGTKFNVTSNDN
jgi:DnaJ family protein A protein 2